MFLIEHGYYRVLFVCVFQIVQFCSIVCTFLCTLYIGRIICFTDKIPEPVLFPRLKDTFTTTNKHMRRL